MWGDALGWCLLGLLAPHSHSTVPVAINASVTQYPWYTAAAFCTHYTSDVRVKLLSLLRKLTTNTVYSYVL
jgi:hypothetical protein